MGESVGEGATAFRGATAQKVQNNFRTEMETALNIIAAFPALSLNERNRHIGSAALPLPQVKAALRQAGAGSVSAIVLARTAPT